MAVEPYVGEISIVAFNYAPEGWLPCDGRILNAREYQALYALLGNLYGGSLSQGTFALPDLRGRLPLGIGQGAGLTPRNCGDKGGFEKTTLGLDQLAPHAHALAPHSHPMPHNHPLGAHSHPMPHTHDMAAHTHTTTHSHSVNAGSSGDSNDPTGRFPGPVSIANGKVFAAAASKVMNSGVISPDSTASSGPSAPNTGASSAANTGDGGSGATGDSSAATTGAAAASTSPAGAGIPFDNMSPFLCLNFIIAVQGVFPPRP